MCHYLLKCGECLLQHQIQFMQIPHCLNLLISTRTNANIKSALATVASDICSLFSFVLVWSLTFLLSLSLFHISPWHIYPSFNLSTPTLNRENILLLQCLYLFLTVSPTHYVLLVTLLDTDTQLPTNTLVHFHLNSAASLMMAVVCCKRVLWLTQSLAL